MAKQIEDLTETVGLSGYLAIRGFRIDWGMKGKRFRKEKDMESTIGRNGKGHGNHHINGDLIGSV